MHIDGGCHCGKIAYEAEIDPEMVSICHCTDCQVLSGTAFRTTVRARAEAFRMLKGEPRIYIKTAESGTRRAHAFCGDCGTPVYATSVTDQQIFGLRLGTVRQRAQLRPRKQIWCRSMLDWTAELESLPKFDKGGETGRTA
jgi:hypothetical protein